MSRAYRRRTGSMVALGLAVPVATTIVYMLALGGPGEAGPVVYFTERWNEIVAVWLTESIGFTIAIIAAWGLAAEARHERASWNMIALGSLGGLLSTAIGIGAFQGFAANGDQFLPLLGAVVNLSFVFFFFGKAATALGVLGLGLILLRQGGVLSKSVGIASALGGLLAGAVNIVAMGRGMELVFPAGAAGTIATALGVLAVLVLTRMEPQDD